MKKLTLSLGLLMGLLSVSSYALTFPNSTNKTSFQKPLVSSLTNGNGPFVTGSVATAITGGGQNCAGYLTATGSSYGTLMSCGATAITGILLSGGASGGTVTIYDAGTNVAYPTQNGINLTGYAEVGNQETVFEATVAANSTTFVDMHDVPIITSNGVVSYATSTSGVVVYTGTGAINQ